MTEPKIVSEFRSCPTAGVCVQRPAAWGVTGHIELTRDGLFIRYITRADLDALEAAGLVTSDGTRIVRAEQFTVRWDTHIYSLKHTQRHLAVFDTEADARAFAEAVEPPACGTRGAVTVADGTGKVLHVRKHPMDALTN